MGSLANRGRCKWQTYGGKAAAGAEYDIKEVFDKAFNDTEFEYHAHPTNFSNIYTTVSLDPQEIKEIYTPSKNITKHGINPDGLIINKNTGKKIYVEIKRQDGWVEGKERTAGRGNAHERLCKYFTPGLLSLLRADTTITDDNSLPFWIIFVGDITRDPCRVREIRYWFTEKYSAHVFFWRDTTNPDPILTHFDTHIDPILQ
jgi:hypothetical protein